MRKYKFDKKEILKLFINRDTHDQLFYLYTLLLDPLGISRLDLTLPKTCRDMDYSFLNSNYDISKEISSLTNTNVALNYDFLRRNGTVDYYLSIVYDFYKQLDPEIFDLFLKHWNTRLGHLNVANRQLFSSYAGEAFMCEKTNDYFISIDNLKTLETAENYCHENGHLIGHHLNMQTPGPKEDTILIELESMFMELIFFDYLDSIDKLKDESKILRTNKFIDMVQMAQKMDLKYKFIDDYYGPIKFKDYIQKLAYKYNMSPKTVKYVFDELAECLYEYVISSVYALDLYNLYQYDKEKALYLYKQACRIKAESADEKMKKIHDIGLKPVDDLKPFVRTLKK